MLGLRSRERRPHFSAWYGMNHLGSCSETAASLHNGPAFDPVAHIAEQLLDGFDADAEIIRRLFHDRCTLVRQPLRYVLGFLASMGRNGKPAMCTRERSGRHRRAST